MTVLALIDQFRSAVENLIGRLPGPGELGVAVSGGPDSLALLALSAEAFPGAITALTVDHGVRPESKEEADYVADICDRMNVPHVILRPEQPITGNVQSAAREARYALLEKWRRGSGARWIATAHHADDQLETVLMRLLRGSGISGLSAIRPVNGAIIRPLLGMRKKELVEYIADRDIVPVMDPSNSDPRFDRARIRQAMANFPEFEPDRIGRSMAALREASEALDWAAQQLVKDCVRLEPDLAILMRTNLPPELLRRLVIHCLSLIDPAYEPRGDTLDRTIASLSAGKNCTIGQILCVPENAENWQFSPAPSRKTG